METSLLFSIFVFIVLSITLYVLTEPLIAPFLAGFIKFYRLRRAFVCNVEVCEHNIFDDVLGDGGFVVPEYFSDRYQLDLSNGDKIFVEGRILEKPLKVGDLVYYRLRFSLKRKGDYKPCAYFKLSD